MKCFALLQRNPKKVKHEMQTGLTKCAFKKVVIQNKSHLKNFTSVTMNHILHPKVEHIIDNRTRQVLDVL